MPVQDWNDMTDIWTLNIFVILADLACFFWTWFLFSVPLDSWCNHPWLGDVQQTRNTQWGCCLGDLQKQDGILQN